jgi:HD-GYP domain-containing protein (c-di-GMP phosphodiesterase class II)
MVVLLLWLVPLIIRLRPSRRKPYAGSVATDLKQTAKELRLAEIIASLSLATDLGNAFPLEKALRNTVLAVGLGQAVGLSGQDLSDVYYLSLLRYLGCTAFAHELAAVVQDDNAMRGLLAPVDGRPVPEVLRTAIRGLDRASGPVARARAVGRFVTRGKNLKPQMVAADCEVAARLATRLGMSQGVRRGLAYIFAQWDGSGIPSAAKDAIPMPARILLIVHITELWYRLAGPDGAMSALARERGRSFDPQLADAFFPIAKARLAEISVKSVWQIALDCEPEPRPWVPTSRLDDVAAAFADFADLKSSYTLGHSSGVAKLAMTAAQLAGIDTDRWNAIYRSALLHDLGRVSVPTAIWEKPGRLTAAEWERVRLHPYYTERALAQSPVLQPLAQLAGSHHERLDGSGYHRAVPASMLSTEARLIAAADAYHAMTEDRPHRRPLSVSAISKELGTEITAGRLDREAVNAVLAAAGHQALTTRGALPAGLSDREVEVLRRVARGSSNREIARALSIAEATVHHHVLHIYQKIGVTTRAGAALFAMENDLLRAQPPEK